MKCCISSACTCAEELFACGRNVSLIWADRTQAGGALTHPQWFMKTLQRSSPKMICRCLTCTLFSSIKLVSLWCKTRVTELWWIISSYSTEQALEISSERQKSCACVVLKLHRDGLKPSMTMSKGEQMFPHSPPRLRGAAVIQVMTFTSLMVLCQLSRHIQGGTACGVGLGVNI